MTRDEGAPVPEQSDVESNPSNVRCDVASSTDELANTISLLSKLLDELSAQAKRDSAKELLISRVVERLDNLERDFLFREFRQPIFQDLMLLSDRATVLSAQFEDDAATTTAFQSIERELLDILRRQGVTPIDESGTVFNPKLQEAMAIESTHDPGMECAVLAVRRRGFTYRGTVIRPQGVVVARYAKEGSCDE